MHDIIYIYLHSFKCTNWYCMVQSCIDTVIVTLSAWLNTRVVKE